MACDLTKSRGKLCKEGISGNSTIYLYNDLREPFTIVDGEATAMNAGLTENYSYELVGDANTLEQSMVGERANGTRINTITLNLVLPKMSAADNAEFNLLAASFAQCVVKTRNGEYLVCGIDDGFDWTIVANTGGAKTDLSGYTVTGVATTNTLAPVLDEATRDAFLAVTVAP